jgi:hypothetical protein
VESAPTPLKIAAVIIVLEAAALIAAAIIVLIKTATESAHNVLGAVLLAAIAAFGAAVLVLSARGLLHLRQSARTPVIVLQVIALPVSFDLAFQAHRYGYGGPILLAALAVIYLLFTPPARAVLDRDPPGR